MDSSYLDRKQWCIWGPVRYRLTTPTPFSLGRRPLFRGCDKLPLRKCQPLRSLSRGFNPFRRVLLTWLTAGTSIPNLGDRINEWNTALPAYVTNFTRTHPGVTASLFDVNTMFQTVLNHPKKYGFKDATSYCSNSNCIWADQVHATYAMQKIIAANMAQLLGTSNATTGASTSCDVKLAPSYFAVAILSFFGLLNNIWMFVGLGLDHYQVSLIYWNGIPYWCEGFGLKGIVFGVNWMAAAGHYR